MGLKFDWTVLLAPLIVRVVEALVNAIIKWIESLPAEEAIKGMAVLMEKVADFEASEDKRAAVKALSVWAKTILPT